MPYLDSRLGKMRCESKEDFLHKRVVTAGLHSGVHIGNAI